MRFSEAWALHTGEEAQLTHLDVYREPQDDEMSMSITEQGRQCPQDAITRIRYLNDNSQPQYT